MWIAQIGVRLLLFFGHYLVPQLTKSVISCIMSISMVYILVLSYFYSCYICPRLEGRKKGEPRKTKIETEELSALQQRLEEKRQQRKQTQTTAKIAPTAKSAQKTRNLINQKVCSMFV